MNTQTDEQIEIDLGRLFTALWRSKQRVLFAGMLAGLLALAGSFLFVRPQYQSTVLFYVNGVSADSAMVLLETGETLDAVAAGSGLDRDRLAKQLSGKTVSETGYFEATVTVSNAAEAKRIADAVAKIMPERVSAVIPYAELFVADVPVLAEKASSPDRPRVALIGAVLGMTLSAGETSLRVIFGTGRKKRRAPARKTNQKEH